MRYEVTIKDETITEDEEKRTYNPSDYTDLVMKAIEENGLAKNIASGRTSVNSSSLKFSMWKRPSDEQLEFFGNYGDNVIVDDLAESKSE